MITVGGNLNPRFAAVATRLIADRNFASDISTGSTLRGVSQISIMDIGPNVTEAQKLNISKLRSQFSMKSLA